MIIFSSYSVKYFEYQRVKLQTWVNWEGIEFPELQFQAEYYSNCKDSNSTEPRCQLLHIPRATIFPLGTCHV